MMPDDEARYWSKVDQTGGPDACWPWKAGKYPDGYGQFWCTDLQKGRRAQAVALEIAFGEPAGGRCACHKCDNPPCCNPEHLFWGTNQENTADRQRKGRQGFHHGGATPWAKLTAETVQAARNRYRPYCSQNGTAALAREFGVSQSTMSLAISGKQWRHDAAVGDK